MNSEQKEWFRLITNKEGYMVVPQFCKEGVRKAKTRNEMRLKKDAKQDWESQGGDWLIAEERWGRNKGEREKGQTSLHLSSLKRGKKPLLL